MKDQRYYDLMRDRAFYSGDMAEHARLADENQAMRARAAILGCGVTLVLFAFSALVFFLFWTPI